MTLVATAPNLVVNGELERHGVQGFRFFSFTPFGVPVLLLGILYMSFARRWLPATGDLKNVRSRQFRGLDRRIQTRGPRRAVCGSRTGRRSSGKNLDEPEPEEHLRRQHRRDRTQPEIFQRNSQADGEDGAGGRRYLADRFVGAEQQYRCASEEISRWKQLPLSGAYFSDRSQEIGMAEVIMPPTSELVGKHACRGRVPNPIWADRDRPAARRRRARRRPAEGKASVRRHPAADRTLEGHRETPRRHRNMAIINLPAEIDERLPAPGRALQALVCLALVIALMVGGIVPNVQAALIGCLLMGVARLHRFRQRLPLDRLENHRIDRRHVAILNRPGADRRCRSGR